ncbi:CshA/CshB family fibrillar adhesin-related protein [Arcanobacterium hippocoleae]|uniref:Prealbumin-like fold domain-containing protein n=1 Tax=Arcanobacterium hippocoleae TaxID=149017 RepID=A0ABU1T2P3_9ACTO|nr:CshA/CshB family fibrillar adhesin-related protein [Arcanobacterium hippocoleae]MDR6939636.1 hypothetical protein [Arcanobacterium hippocoleae]
MQTFAVVATAAVALAVSVFPLDLQQAHAEFAKGGSDPNHTSKYLGMIDWIDWTKAKNPAQMDSQEVNWSGQKAGSVTAKNIQDGYTVVSDTQVGSNRIVTTCTLNNFFSNTIGQHTTLEQHQYSSSPATGEEKIYFHTPGSYNRDGWPKIYQKYDAGKKIGIPVGIGGGDQDIWKLLRFDVKCGAKLVRANKQKLDIPISGLVFADAETMSPQELYRVVPDKIDPAEPVNWSLLEYHKAADDPVDMSVRKLQGQSGLENSKLQNLDKHRGIEVTNKMRDSSTDPFATPTFYASNSDGAYFELKTKGGNYIAIGVVVGVDLGDGPESYGQAGAMGQQLIKGDMFTALESVTDNRYLKLSDQRLRNTVVKGVPDSYLGEKGPDLETLFVGDDSWTTLQNDDNANYTSLDTYDDEDAVSGPLITAAYPGLHDLQIKCTPTTVHGKETNIAAWVDWNADGKFTETERYDTLCDRNTNTARLKWNVTSQMLPSADKADVAKSLLRLVATVQDPVTEPFDHGSLVIRGEVEDHAVTLVRPAINITKSVVGTAGTPGKNTNLSNFEFTAKIPGVDFLDDSLQAKQSTDNLGKASWRMKFAADKNKPIPLTTNVDDLTNLQTGIQATVEELKRAEYQLYPQPVCQIQPKAPWTSTIPVGNVADNNTINQPNTYAWPKEDPLTLESVAASETIAGGFKIPFSPSSAVNCVVKNQPYAKISIKPTLDNAALENGAVYDPNLRFSGTYTCTPPANGSAANAAEVKGDWGPIGANQAWTSDPAKAHIIPGSSCTFKQTKISSQNTTENALPVAGSALYRWKDAQVGQPITAKAVLAGEELQEASVINSVEKVKLSTLSWRAVDGGNTPLAGAAYRVELRPTAGAASNIDDITDCVAETAAACTGADKDPGVGTFRIENVPVGGYQIIETIVPPGYEQPSDISGTLGAGDIAAGGKNAGDFPHSQIKASVLPQLPITGGLGTYIFVLFGVGIIAVATFGGITVYQRREKGGSN